MTEYEMSSLFISQMNLIDAELMNFFSILTAFLVAGYAASHRLTLPVAIFVTSMFVVGAIYFVARVLGTINAMKGLAGHMRAAALAGKDLAWNPAGTMTPTIADTIGPIMLVVMVSGAIGGIYFFFQMRRHNMKAAA